MPVPRPTPTALAHLVEIEVRVCAMSLAIEIRLEQILPTGRAQHRVKLPLHEEPPELVVVRRIVIGSRAEDAEKGCKKHMSL